MRTYILTAIILLTGIFNSYSKEYKNPLVFGNNRITLITPTLIRLEYAENAQFIDDKTLFAYHRDSLLLDFKVIEMPDNSYEIRTSKLKIRYQHDGFPFGLWNFQVYFTKDGKDTKFTVRNVQNQNLGGAISTLDRVKKAIPLDKGLLSRDGWHIITDTRTDLLKNDWIEKRPDSHIQDLYCFIYGNDYRTALSDLGVISGKVPMTRKSVHGVWYCRWWDYTADDYLKIVQEYREHQFPLDNIVFDMGWHTSDAGVGTGHSNNRSWTGYTWNKGLIQNPQELVKNLNADSLTVSLNDHPHDGIRPNESMYVDFMKAMGEIPDGHTILFDAGNKKYMTNFLKYAHQESWDNGIAFWWLDWQQDYLYPNVRGTNATHLQWLNELYYRESERNGLRGANYSRWAGWGDQRHPIQFSGDAYANWDMLSFEVELTATSGNAGCYYWAHDIGGFYGGKDPELYARWTQFGAVSGALRVHSQLDKDLDRRPWLWGDMALKSMRESYTLRAQLMPYIYSSVWQTHQTMVPLNRSMYIDYGNDEKAYHNPQQFMFGDLLLAAPITKAGIGSDLTATQNVWFPGSDLWYDYFDGKVYSGGTEAEISKDLNSFPLFVKGGCLLPMQPFSQRPASVKLEKLILRAYPANKDIANTFTLYEDDGISTEYEKERFATTDLTYKSEGNCVRIIIGATKGTYNGQPAKRSYLIELPSTYGIKNLRIGNKKAKPVYDKDKKMYFIEIKKQDIRKVINVDYIAISQNEKY